MFDTKVQLYMYCKCFKFSVYYNWRNLNFWLISVDQLNYTFTFSDVFNLADGYDAKSANKNTSPIIKHLQYMENNMLT